MVLEDYRRNIIANSPHLALASGAVATFSDGADLPLKSLNVDIEPVQDLHGYEYPWVGGGGKNLAKVTDKTFTKSGVTLVFANGEIIFNGTCNTGSWITPDQSVTLPAGTYTMSLSTTGITGSGNLVAYGINKTGIGYLYVPNSGATQTKTFTLGAEETLRLDGYVYNGNVYNNAKIKFQIERGSTATAYAPYENICPISGRDGVKVTRCGKNLLQCPTSGGRTNSGITWTYNSDGSVTASGTATGNSWSYGSPPATVTLPQGTYTASVTSPFGLVVQNLTDGGYFYNGGNSQKTFTLNKQTQISVHARVANGTAVDATTGIQIEKGSSATPYEPYNGVTIWYVENALKPSPVFTETQNGLTFTSDGKGTYSVKGTNTATETVRSAILPVPSFTIPPSATHTFYLNNNAINSNVFLSFMIGSTAVDSLAFNVLNRTAPSYGTMGNKLCDGLRIVVAAGQTVDITFSPMLLPKENTDAYIIGGKNLFSNFEEGDKTDSGITFDFSDSDVVKISGTSTAINASSQNKIIGGTNAPTPIEFIQGNTYTISLQGTVSVSKADDFRIFLRTSSNTNLWYGDSTNGVWTFTPESTFVAERIMFRIKSNGTTVNVDAHLRIELGIIYGGTLNPLTGVLTLDRQFFELDGNSNVTKGSSGTTQATECKPYWATIYIPCNNATYNYSAWRFSHGKCQAAAYSGIFRTLKTNNTTIQVTVGTDALLSTTEDAKAWLQAQKDAGKPLQVVAELATPFEIQLTPQQVHSLYGNNTIFADTGNVAIEYWAHP